MVRLESTTFLAVRIFIDLGCRPIVFVPLFISLLALAVGSVVVGVVATRADPARKLPVLFMWVVTVTLPINAFLHAYKLVRVVDSFAT